MRKTFRIVFVWLLIAVVESLLGTVRQFFLRPWLGEATARWMGFFASVGMILLIATASAHWMDVRGWRGQLQAGAIWVVLMVGFEIAIGRAQGFGWERIAAEYDPRAGGWMILGMLWLWLAPVMGCSLARNRPAG